MTGSNIIHITSGKVYGATVSQYDCCQSLGDQVMQYSSGNGVYKYICVIPFIVMDNFFLKKKNLLDYLQVIDDVFDFKSIILEDIEYLNDKIKTAFPPTDHYYIEIISNRKRNNKEVVAYHNALRYTWYLHYSNIATACVNLLRLKILPDGISILAVASSYQTQEGRALLPSKLTEIDAFIEYYRNCIGV
jgi:hypothetical protein